MLRADTWELREIKRSKLTELNVKNHPDDGVVDYDDEKCLEEFDETVL